MLKRSLTQLYLSLLSKSVAETVKGGGATASKEANKAVAKDEDASIGTRLGAAKDAVGDKANEMKHDAASEANKQKAQH
jgi:hypothetical protein